jgi:hypothetical protein
MMSPPGQQPAAAGPPQARPSVPMYSAPPPGGGAPNGAPPGYPAPPSPSGRDGAAGGVRPSPTHYPQLAGGGGDVDQPLAEKFCSLTVSGGAGGHGSGVAPEQLPRPTPDELAGPLRLEARAAAMDGPDLGQCHPKFMRMTVNAIPSTAGIKTKSGLPAGDDMPPALLEPNAPHAPP